MAVVNEAYAAYNSGDVERWVAMRDRGSYYASEEEKEASLKEYTQWVESEVAEGGQFTDIQCESHGQGRWPGIADAGVIAEGHYFTCDAVLTPDTLEGGGPMNFKWVIADGEVVAVTAE